MPSSAKGVPVPPRHSTAVDDYFGTKLADKFRWLEDDEVAARAYGEEATADADRRLSSLPGYARMRASITTALASKPSVQSVTIGGSSTFFLRRDADAQSPKLIARSSSGQERVLLDIETDTRESGATIDFVRPSPSGRFVAIGMSHKGDEQTSVRVLETSSAKLLPDDAPRVRLATLEWLPDESGFVYLRNQKVEKANSTERLKRARLIVHRLGHAAEDDVELSVRASTGEDLLGELSTAFLDLRPGAEYAVLGVHKTSVDIYVSVFRKPIAALLSPTAGWEPVASAAEGTRDAFSRGRSVVVLRDPSDSPAEVVALEGPKNAVRPRTLYRSESTAHSVTSFALLGPDILVAVNDTGSTKILRVAAKSGASSDVPLPYIGSISGLSTVARGDRVIFGYEGWLQPRSWFGMSVNDSTPRAIVSAEAPEDFKDVIVERTEVVARDGERIPITTLRRPSAKSPYDMVWLTVYGSYGFSTSPYYKATRPIFLNEGGVLAFAHIRGGSENGRSWHDAARGIRKLKAVEDTIDVSAALHRDGIVRPGGLGIMGTSAGGITVGMAIVTRPELFGAAVINSGVTSVVRDERKGTLGAMNAIEFGSSKTEGDFREFVKVDPYFNVRDGVAYPPVLLTAGWRDARVAPWHASKFRARLLEANAGSAPVLLRIADIGHIRAKTVDAAVDFETSVMSFFLWQLGSKNKTAAP